jgi:hypothetical protein
VWHRGERQSGLRDIVELLEGIGTILMVISARLDEIVDLLGGDEE